MYTDYTFGAPALSVASGDEHGTNDGIVPAVTTIGVLADASVPVALIGQVAATAHQLSVLRSATYALPPIEKLAASKFSRLTIMANENTNPQARCGQ